MANAVSSGPGSRFIPLAPSAAYPSQIALSRVDTGAAHQERLGPAVVQWDCMTKKSSSKTSSTAQPGHLQALLDPLGSMASWTSLATARHELELLASNAIGMRNHSLWWNYIYLHEAYVEKYSPRKTDMLPGFPDMDTAIKVGAPSVYNWYYERHRIPTTPWADVPFVDLSLAKRAGFLADDQARSLLRASLAAWHKNPPPDARRQTAAPLWLLAQAWGTTPEWGALMNVMHGPGAHGQAAGVSILDRLVMDPSILWQWQCLSEKDIGFMGQPAASQALDTLRMGGISDTLRARSESHFLSYFPQCKPEAEIAFALGGPLWISPVEALDSPVLGDVFEAGPEALRQT